ncbi:hypothetical protein IV102_30805 [bacterium]|nr:hypothetical protein [bacterium]
MSETEATEKPIDELLATLIQNYQVSSKLQQDVLDNIRRIADSAYPEGEPNGTKLSPGESMILWALSQQLDVIRSQMTQLEQINLTILKQVLQKQAD